MSISNLAASRKRIRKPFISIIVVSVIIIFLSTCISGTALAGEVGDVVSKVVNSHYQSPEFEFGAEEVTGYGFKMHAGYGGYANGFGGISVLGPVESGDMNILLNYVDSQAQHTSIQTTKMKGCEVREYTMPDGNGVGVILPDYFITVETYQSGNSSSTDFQKAKIIAQQVLDGLESNGLLSQPAPEIDKPVPEEQTDAEAVTGNESMVSGIPLGDPVAVSDTMNIAGVYNGPTAPTVFSISSPHLVTYICTYHWNNAQGAAPGTIALQHSDGTVYGPWQVSTRPGQGGVPNAYWEVTPNVVIPAGTYTVIDSDPATWAQNGESGGRGMGEVRATPYFEITGGSADNIHGGGKTSPWGGYIESPAGVGSVGNIPGPSNTTEAIVGVAVPGLIATALGALAGLGGGGGFTPSGGTPLSPGGGSVPGNGGPYPGRPAQEATQLGRKRRDEVYVSGPESDPGIIIDTAEMGEGIITVQEIIIDTDEMGQGSITVPGRDGILIEPAEEAGIFVKSEAEMIIETADEEAILVQTEPGLIIETAQEEAGVIRQGSDVLIDNTDSGILIDTSALEDEIPVGTEGHKSPADASDITGENVYDQEGYDQAGFDAEGFDKAGYDANGFDQEGYNQAGYDREGFNREGFDKDGYDREGYDKSGFDAEGFDREGFDKAGYDANGFDKEGYNQAGYDAEGFNREGFDQAGFDREGYDKSGFDAEGFDKEGFDKAGYDANGFDKEGYNQAGYDKEGFNREGFDKAGYDREGYDKSGFDAEGFDKEGFDKAGYDANGFDKEGYNQAGYDREGFNREGFDKAGYDREGYDKSGFDPEGFDKEGFDKAGYDRDGYGRSGYDAEGYNREGYDVNGYDRKGYNRSGYDAQGYNKQGYDREGFDKDGWDRDGYNRQGLDHNGYDREGFDKDGYDREGYNRDGHNREGQSKEGYDEYGYDKKGFNKDGYDRDGFDREGFDYEGYNRSGYDPWGFDRQGYGKDGYHWSGYNADGYNRDGRHWSENPFEGDGNPFNVAVQDPFGEGEVIPFGTKWVPVKPKLGEPYPRTAEKYGAKPWTDEIPKGEPEVPSGPSSSASGVIGPEDPMNTLEKHDVGGGDSSQPPADQSVKAGDNDSFTYTDPETGQTSSYEYEKGYTGPRHGETQVLVGKTDGRPYELEFDAVKGKWINTESGNEFNPDDFERWQNDLAEDKRRIAIDLEKMAERQDATSKAIKQNMDDWQKLEQMQKAADKYNIGQPGGPGDVDKAIQKLKDDMLAGKELDREQVDKIRRVIDNRILGKTAADTGERWEELPWYKDIGSALKANAAMAKEVVTAQKEDGSISWLGLAARTMIIAASGGAATVSGVVMDGTLTVAEAMLRIQESIEKGESDFVAVSKALGITILGEEIGWLAGKAGGAIMGEMLEKFPVFTNKAADFIETALLKIMKADQIASRSLGMISKESAEEMLGQIEKRLTDLAGDAAEESMEKVFKGAGRGAAGSVDDIATRAGKSVSGSTDDLGKGSGKTAGSGADDLGKGSGKTAGSSADDLGKGSGKTAGSGADDLGKGSGKTSSAGPDVEGTEKTPFGRKESDAPGTGKTASGSSDNMPDGTRKTTADEGVPKSSDSSDRVGKTTPSSPDGPDGPRKPASGSGGDGPDPGGKIPGKDEGPVSSSLPKVNDYYGQAGKQVEVDNYAHINMDMDRVRQTMEANKLVAGDNGAVYAAPPKAGVPGYEYTNTTTVRISNQNLVDVRIRTGSGGQMQYVTPKGEVIDPSLLKDKVLMTPNSEGTGVILTYYDPQGQVRSYIPARFLERWSDAVNGFAPMG